MASPARRRLSRLVAVALPIAILVVILGAVSTVGFVQLSSQPGFCKSCHIMEPYYQSWTSSSHRNITCTECHIAPGVRAEAMTKIQAANMVVKYFTGAYGTRPWADIDDASCLRSGCHSERLIEGAVEFKGVRFDHQQHLGEFRRGIQLRCTSCHSQMVQGDHIAVTEGTCFLCHFKDRPSDRPLAGCTGCHPSPARVTSPEGYRIDHAQYVKDRVDCLSCHNEVKHGSGNAEAGRCVACHNEPARLAEFNNPTLLHQKHVDDHHVACVQCHTAVEHRVVALTASVELDCKACHREVHREQQRLLAGVGGNGVPPTPSSMYQARVSCVACHDKTRAGAGHDSVQVAGEASCLSCHGVRYANVLPQWQREMERKVAAVEPIVNAARQTVAATPLGRRGVVDSLVGLAQENLKFVKVGRGAHNVVYADRLLRASLDLVRQAARAGLPYQAPSISLGPPLSESACLQCHLGVERKSGTFQGVAFDHTPHVVKGGLNCTSCHTPVDEHGKTTLGSPAACNSCHHQVIRPANCATCHAAGGGTPGKTDSTKTGDFSHQVHAAANLPCSGCHIAPSMSARDLKCDNCHDNHHQPAAECISCHRGGVLASHTKEDHVACAECHSSVPKITKWSREVCTACHADKRDHNVGEECEVCHDEVKPMGKTAPTGAGPAAISSPSGPKNLRS